MLLAGGYDLSDAAFAVSFFERANGGAGELVFAVPNGIRYRAENGDEVSFSIGGETLFHGYVFSIEQYAAQSRITALDSLRYLSAVMPIERKNETAAAFAARAISAAGGRVSLGAVEDNAAVLSEKRCNKALLRAIYDSINESVKAGGERLILRDENGKTALRRESSLALSTVLGEESIADGFSRTRSIGEGVVNYAKVTAENKSAGMRISAIAQNNELTAKWGKLSRTVSGRGEAQALLAAAGDILGECCRESERITVSAKGDARVRAGCLITLKLPNETAFWARVLTARHDIKTMTHTMRLELERL